MAIRCPCGGKTKISNTRSTEFNTTKRNHRCVVCFKSFVTIEAIESESTAIEMETMRMKLAGIKTILEE